MLNGIRPESLGSIVDLLDRRAELHPQRHAFTFLKNGEIESEQLTFGELHTRVRAVAAHLQQRGMQGKAALLLYPQGLDFIVAFYGCLYARVVAIPAVPPRLNRSLANLDGIMADADAAVILTNSALVEKLSSLYADPAREQRYEILVTDTIADALHADWRATDIARDDLAFLQYTSGSTGSPKGVMVSHGNLLDNHGLLRALFEADETARYVSWLPHFHDMGLIGNIMQVVYLGAPCYLMSPSAFVKKPACWLQAIGKYRATVSGAPNFAYQYCVDRISDEQRESLDLSAWRIAYCGAEPVRAQTMRDFHARFAGVGFRETALYPCYGMAEATLVISGGRIDERWKSAFFDRAALEQRQVVRVAADHPNAHALVGCGRESAGQQIRIVDPETRRPCATDAIGEIWVSSPSVCQGYLNKPEVSAQTYRASHSGDPERMFVRSGDLGFFDADGELYIAGRSKDVLIVRGRNHYPQDIELTVQHSHEALAVDCGAAFSIEVDGQERVVVVQEATREYVARFDLGEIVAAAATALSDAFELQLYAFVLLRPGRLPKTSSGKIQRSAARRQYFAGELQALASWTLPPREIDNAGPVDEQEAIDLQNEELVRSWLLSRLRSYLQAIPDDVDGDQPLAGYGLDSSVALQLVEEITRLTKRDVEPTLLWEYPTLNALSARIVEVA